MFTKDLLKNKRILITGGGTGLGKEMASHFAEYGADIYIYVAEEVMCFKILQKK